MTALAWFRQDDRWIPSLFVGAFLVILAVNGTMIWLALSTFGGLATADYYDRGRTYNKTLAAAETMANLGWKVDVVSDRMADGRYLVAVIVADADGTTLDGARVTGNLVRPASAQDDLRADLQAQGNGRWTIQLDPGLWDLRLLVERNGNQLATGHRLELMP